ncbi:MAG: PAS domain-containing protein [Pedobacter sp.]|uniref:PAS domain-containing sensor histidine kinase n=1 Tax=Pedobacter sp. TaxID=1411316 RepID=UPI00280679A0|nr:PAS domain-containing protein [Pedobacter sp.]MDQ8003587.1 PAS domain-containing protein [Pedobacter sp.]
MLSLQLQLAILEQSIDATAIYDSEELHISFVNQGMLQIWGKDTNVIGKTFEIAIPEIAGQPFVALLKNVWLTGQTYTATSTPATLEINGKLKTSFFDFEYRAIKNEQNKVIAILHTARDVSSKVDALDRLAQKQEREQQLIADLRRTDDDMQAANLELRHINKDINRLNTRLQESETDFKRLVEKAPVAILVFRGPEMTINLVNESMLEILDKDKNIIGKPLLEGLPEIEGAPAVNMLFEVFNTGKTLEGAEQPVPIKRNGLVQTRYFNFSYRPLINDGTIIGVMDVAVDVTEQVLARKKLEANEQRLQSILDTMAEGVMITDTNGKVTYANGMAQIIMGVSLNDLKNRHYNDEKWTNERLDGSLLPKDEHPLFIILKTQFPVYDQEVAIVKPSGERHYISINAAPLLNQDNQLTGGIISFTDVTKRRKVLQQKEDFINVASHELKTPVTALKGSLQLLEKMQGRLSEENSRKLVEQANRSLTKLSNLISTLLNVNRISQGRFPINKTKFKIYDLVKDCCSEVNILGKHELVLKGDLNLEIEADVQLIEQVLVNLVNNAVKYAPDSKEIIVNMERLPEGIKISVADSGPGIPQEKAKHIFKRYYQAENLGAYSSGLGLGLYISAEIIEKHGGKIGVDSETGKGSNFWFTIPH